MKFLIIFVLTNATLILAQEFDVAQKPQQTRIGVGIMLTEQGIRGDLTSLEPLEYFNPITNEWLIEQWKPIRDYERLYEISNLGRVRSVERIISHSNSKRVPVHGRILKLTSNENGYFHIRLSKDNQKKTLKIHLTVWECFGEQPRGEKHVDHIDNDKSNNRIDNLQLLTQRENVAKSYKDRGRILPTGVLFRKDRGNYRATIQINRIVYWLGVFDNPEDASLAYQNKLREMT